MFQSLTFINTLYYSVTTKRNIIAYPLQIVGVALKRIEGDRCCAVDDVTKMIIETKALDFLRRNKATLSNLYIPQSESSDQNELMT